MEVLIFITISIFLLFIISNKKVKKHIPRNILRRGAHVFAAVINIAAPFYVEVFEIVLVNIFFFFALLLARKTKYLSAIQEQDRKSFGDLFFTLGIVFAAIFILPQSMVAFQYGVAIMGFSDAIAGLVGEKIRRKSCCVFPNSKTIEGTLSFFAMSFVVGIFTTGSVSLEILILAAIFSLVELCLIYGLDNLILPFVAGLGYLIFI